MPVAPKLVQKSILPVSAKKKFTAIGAYLFAGGFSLGMRQAGFHIRCHLEGGKYGVSSAKLNWPNLPIHVGEENWPLDELAGRVDVIVANPPCAPWSTAGPSTTRGPDSWRSDPRVECWHQCFRVLEGVMPKVFVVESVTQAYIKGRSFMDEKTMRALDLGYSVTHLLTDAKWCGIPQSRRRFFFVAHLPSIDFRPSFSFDDPPTVGDFLSGVGDPGEVGDSSSMRDGRPFAELHRQCVLQMPQGGKMRNVYNELNKKLERGPRGNILGRPGFLICRLDESKQMGAFIGDVFYHPTKHRRLGINEMKALCGYPLDFKLDGAPREHSSLLARAVLPPVGKWLGTTIDQALRRPPLRLSKQSVTLVDLRKPGIPAVSLTELYLGGGA